MQEASDGTLEWIGKADVYLRTAPNTTKHHFQPPTLPHVPRYLSIIHNLYYSSRIGAGYIFRTGLS
jgi:hypothetical protein